MAEIGDRVRPLRANVSGTFRPIVLQPICSHERDSHQLEHERDDLNIDLTYRNAAHHG
jgi:hypothetical protein